MCVRVRACVCMRVRLCMRAGRIVCMRARQARPWRLIHSQWNSVPSALGSTLLRHARCTRSQSRSSLTHPSLRRSARADSPAPPTVSAGASAVSERLLLRLSSTLTFGAVVALQSTAEQLAAASEAVVQGTSPHGMLRASAVRSPQCISRCCCVGTLNRRVCGGPAQVMCADAQLQGSAPRHRCKNLQH